MGGRGIGLESLLAEGATEVCISDEETLHMCTRNRNTTHVYTRLHSPCLLAWQLVKQQVVLRVIGLEFLLAVYTKKVKRNYH